jgi:hypothetical protein
MALPPRGSHSSAAPFYAINDGWQLEKRPTFLSFVTTACGQEETVKKSAERSGRSSALLRHRPLKTGHATFAASGLNHQKSGYHAQPAAQLHTAFAILTDSFFTSRSIPYQPVERVKAASTSVVDAVICLPSEEKFHQFSRW